VWLPGFFSPAQAGSTQETSIAVQIEGSTLAGVPDNVAARLTARSGTPVAGVPVEIWMVVEILGARTAPLGTAVTDATGVARVPITPRRSDYEIRATFEGTDLYAPSETAVVITFPAETVEPVEITAPVSPLANLRTVMPRVMGIVVALLWIFFGAAVFYVVKTIRGHSTAADDPALDNPQLAEEGDRRP
jgi:hypothetical protein